MAEVADEAQLVEAAKKDPQAFAVFYDRYFDRIYAYAYNHTGSQAEAEDVTAQTFKQALENIGRYEWRGVPMAAWLYRIASNVITGMYRRKRPTSPFEEAIETPGGEPTPEENFLSVERNSELADLVRGLPKAQRTAIVLRFSQNLSYAEIADSIGRTEGAVKQLIHRALVTLRQEIKRE